MSHLFRKPFLLVMGCALIVLGIQTVRIERPFLGHFDSYQHVMGQMARNMEREHFREIFLPKTDILVGGERSLHLNQYPFPSLAAALGQRFLGGSLELWGRGQAIAANLLSAFILFFLAARFFDVTTATLAAAIYLLSPYTILYGQCFISEPFSLLFLLLGFYLVSDMEKRSLLKVLAGGACFGLAVAGRIHFVLVYPVLALYLLFAGGSQKRFILTACFTLFALGIPAGWYSHTYFAGRDADNLLTNLFLQLGARKVGDKSYLLDPEYFRRIFDVLLFMVNPLALGFVAPGLVALFKRKGETLWLVLAGFLSGFGIIVLFPQKVMAHDFYLYAFFPFLCMIAAEGVSLIFKNLPEMKRPTVILFCLVIYLFASARYFLHPVFVIPSEDRAVREDVRRIQTLIPPEEKIIVAAFRPSPLFYYLDRPAWLMQMDQVGKKLPYYFQNSRFSSLSPEQVSEEEAAMKDPVLWFESLRKKGASYFVAAHREELDKLPSLENYLKNTYEQVSDPKNGFCVYKIVNPKAV